MIHICKEWLENNQNDRYHALATHVSRYVWQRIYRVLGNHVIQNDDINGHRILFLPIS
jgi:hypothetical protein